MLLQQPALLAHRKAPHDRERTFAFHNSLQTYYSIAIGPLDRLVGALTADGHHIVTSPNAAVVYEPPLGADRKIFMRMNLRYGDDDPLQWPQPYIQEHRHMACIPKGPSGRGEPNDIMWWTPQPTDFVHDNRMICGIGKLNAVSFEQLRRPCVSLLERAKQPRFQDKELPWLLVPIVANFLHRLQVLSMSFQTTTQCVLELQRAFLELLAFLEFEEHYRHRRDATTVATQLMGAFTTSQLVCQGMMDAGVPVWLIRPYDDLPTIRIQKVVTMKQARALLSMDACVRPPCSTIFEGRGDSVAKYAAISMQATRLLAFPNPFASTRARIESTPPLTVERSKRQIRSEKYSPCMILNTLLDINF